MVLSDSLSGKGGQRGGILRRTLIYVLAFGLGSLLIAGLLSLVAVTVVEGALPQPDEPSRTPSKPDDKADEKAEDEPKPRPRRIRPPRPTPTKARNKTEGRWRAEPAAVKLAAHRSASPLLRRSAPC